MLNKDLLYKSDYFSFLLKTKNNKLPLPMKFNSSTKARYKNTLQVY